MLKFTSHFSSTQQPYVATGCNIVELKRTFSSSERVPLSSAALVHLLSIRLDTGRTGTIYPLHLWKEISFKPCEIDSGLLIFLLYLDKYWPRRGGARAWLRVTTCSFNYTELGQSRDRVKNKTIADRGLSASPLFVCEFFFFFR